MNADESDLQKHITTGRRERIWTIALKSPQSRKEWEALMIELFFLLRILVS
jgi:hypothetical protein